MIFKKLHVSSYVTINSSFSLCYHSPRIHRAHCYSWRWKVLYIAYVGTLGSFNVCKLLKPLWTNVYRGPPRHDAACRLFRIFLRKPQERSSSSAARIFNASIKLRCFIQVTFSRALEGEPTCGVFSSFIEFRWSCLNLPRFTEVDLVLPLCCVMMPSPSYHNLKTYQAYGFFVFHIFISSFEIIPSDKLLAWLFISQTKSAKINAHLRWNWPPCPYDNDIGN